MSNKREFEVTKLENKKDGMINKLTDDNNKKNIQINHLLIKLKIY